MEYERDNGEMMQFLLVIGGGALGAAGRYGLSLVLPKSLWTVSIVNILGSFLAIWLFNSLLQGLNNENMRLFALVGFLGAFTTFSAFSLESIQLLQANKLPALAIYIATNVIGSLAAAFMAWKLFPTP